MRGRKVASGGGIVSPRQGREKRRSRRHPAQGCLLCAPPLGEGMETPSPVNWVNASPEGCGARQGG